MNCVRGSTPAYGLLYRLLVVVLFRQAFQFFEKDDPSVRGDLEALSARLARHVVIDADQVVLALAEDRAVARVGARRDLCLLRAPHPPDGIVVRAAATRALEAAGTLLGLFAEELTLIHTGKRTTRKTGALIDWFERFG